MIFKCPGSQAFSQPHPENIECPFCGADVEIFSDEVKADCPKCKKAVLRDSKDICLDWCKYAKECVGEKALKKYKENKGGRIMKVFRCRVCGDVYIGDEKPASCPFCGAHEKYFVLAKEWSLLHASSLSDITKENLKKALDLEINNTNFYRAVSKRSKDVQVSSMFKGLSKVENEHASTICKHLQIQHPSSNVGSDKAVDKDKENIKEANRRERSAVKFYGEAAKAAPENQIKEFFSALMQIESDHIKLTD